MGLIMQEVSRQVHRNPRRSARIYQLWRPTPLIRARRLEKALDTRRTSTTSTKASRERQSQAQYRRSAAYYNKQEGAHA